MEAIEGDMYIDQLDQFTEAGACGTAVITPVGGIQHKGKFHVLFRNGSWPYYTQTL